jgi:hypothetical protein
MELLHPSDRSRLLGVLTVEARKGKSALPRENLYRSLPCVSAWNSTILATAVATGCIYRSRQAEGGSLNPSRIRSLGSG